MTGKVDKGNDATRLEDKVQPDVEYKEFWEDAKHFADLFNGV